MSPEMSLEIGEVSHWIAVALVTITSASRLTRLVVADKFPPVLWVRSRYEERTEGTGWEWLTMCAYCFSFWATLAVVLTGWLSDWHTAWWVVFGSLGASYLAAILMTRDGDPGDDEDDD